MPYCWQYRESGSQQWKSFDPSVNVAIAIHCDDHILISFVFPQFTSFHSVLTSCVNKLTVEKQLRLQVDRTHDPVMAARMLLPIELIMQAN